MVAPESCPGCDQYFAAVCSLSNDSKKMRGHQRVLSQQGTFCQACLAPAKNEDLKTCAEGGGKTCETAHLFETRSLTQARGGKTEGKMGKTEKRGALIFM